MRLKQRFLPSGRIQRRAFAGRLELLTKAVSLLSEDRVLTRCRTRGLKLRNGAEPC